MSGRYKIIESHSARYLEEAVQKWKDVGMRQWGPLAVHPDTRGFRYTQAMVDPDPRY